MRDASMAAQREAEAETLSKARVERNRQNQLSKAIRGLILSAIVLIACAVAGASLTPILVPRVPAPPGFESYIHLEIKADHGFTSISPIVNWDISPADVHGPSTFTFGFSAYSRPAGSIKLTIDYVGSHRIFTACFTRRPTTDQAMSVPIGKGLIDFGDSPEPTSSVGITVPSDEAGSEVVISCDLDVDELWQDSAGSRSLKVPSLDLWIPTEISVEHAREARQIWNSKHEPTRITVNGGSRFQYTNSSVPVSSGYSRLNDVSWHVPTTLAYTDLRYPSPTRSWVFQSPTFTAAFDDVAWDQEFNLALLVAGFLLGLLPATMVWMGNAVWRIRKLRHQSQSDAAAQVG